MRENSEEEGGREEDEGLLRGSKEASTLSPRRRSLLDREIER